jgi:hypothetical protein
LTPASFRPAANRADFAPAFDGGPMTAAGEPGKTGSMQVTTHDHGVEVAFRTRVGRHRRLHSFEVLWPAPILQDEHLPPRERDHGARGLGMEAALGLAVLGALLVLGILVGAYFYEGIQPTWPAMLLMVGLCGPIAIPFLWFLSRTRIATKWRPVTREHTLRLDPAGAWLDGRRCEVWLAGNRLVTGHGELYEVVEAPDDLRKLRGLVAAGAPLVRDRIGDTGDVPQALRSMRGAGRRQAGAPRREPER